MRRLLLAAAVLLVGSAAAPAGAEPGPTVEATYAAVGPAGDAIATGVVVDGSGATTHRLYWPTALEGRHAVVAWGNGSFEHPDKYEPLLRHLASWGFIVVAAETDSAGTGEEILAGARSVITGDTDPASPFFGHVDGAHVAAAGHSQGAGGSVRAATDPSGVITTVVPVALPAELFQLLGAGHDYHPDRLRVPVLFMSGADDTFISPAGTVARYYGQVPGAAAMAILEGADHNTVQIDGGGFRGYLTAWLRWQLTGDLAAAGAFVGDAPELLTDPAWRDQRVKGLAGPSGPTSVVADPTTTTGPAAGAGRPGPGGRGPGAGPLPATGGDGAAIAPALLALAVVVRSAAARRAHFVPRGALVRARGDVLRQE